MYEQPELVLISEDYTYFGMGAADAYIFKDMPAFAGTIKTIRRYNKKKNWTVGKLL